MLPGDIDMESIARELHQVSVAATPGWVKRCIGQLVTKQQINWPVMGDSWLELSVEQAVEFIDCELDNLLVTDIDQQRTTPLSIFRAAVQFPAELLNKIGADPVNTSDTVGWKDPSDHFGLTPGNLADISYEVSVAGARWGAAKAGLHLVRRQAEGLT